MFTPHISTLLLYIFAILPAQKNPTGTGTALTAFFSQYGRIEPHKDTVEKSAHYNCTGHSIAKGGWSLCLILCGFRYFWLRPRRLLY